MAEQIVSPGVFTRENDQSFITQQPVTLGAAILGPTVKGPVEVPTVVTSYSEFKNKFGTTFISESQTYSFLTSISAYNYFQNGGESLLVTRVQSGSWTSATSTDIQTSGIDSGTVSTAVNALSSSTAAITGSAGTYTVTGSVLGGTGTAGTGFTASVVLATPGNVLTSITVNEGSLLFGVGNTITIASSSLGYTTAGGTNTVITLVADDLVNVPAITLKTISEGIIQNSSGTEDANGALTNGTSDNVRWEVTNSDTTKGTFTLNIRRGDDLTNEKVILETFANVSLDPEQDNYVGKAIGDSFQTLKTDGTVSYLEETGEYPNVSKYVYVSAVNKPTAGYFDNNGTAKNEFTASIPQVGSGSFASGTGTILTGTGKYFDKITSADSQGLVGENYDTAISLLNNKDEYQYNVISAPGLIHTLANHTSALNTLITNTQNRGDAITVLDIEDYGATVSAAVTAAQSLNSSYAAAYWPWVQIQNPDTGKLNFVPASTLIPGVYAFNDANAEPWFAPAGINRGGLDTVIRPERKLTKSNRDTLYEANVNPIASFPANGTVVFGQKTLQKKASALDRVNVRRLLIALKSFIGQTANNLVFEQNSAATRNSFLASVNPYLESVQQRQGVYAFKVVMDDTNNTPDVVDRNQLVGQIFLQPTRTAEFIILDFNVLPTGAEFSS